MATTLNAGTATGGAAISADTTGVLALQSGSTPTTAVTIDTAQNVGIGTSSPQSKLDVATTIRVNYAANTTYYSTLTNPNGATYLYSNGDSSPLVFGTTSVGGSTATERMRIDSSGNLNINNASALSSSRVSVWNATNGSGGLGVGYGSTAGQFRIMYTLSNGVFYFDNGTNTPSLSSAGAWTNASDARLKNNITDIKYGLSTVLNTQPRSYKMNDLDGEYIGFVAQELQTVIPEVVSGDPEKQLGVDYGSLVAVAFKAIQELNAKVTALEAQLGVK